MCVHWWFLVLLSVNVCKKLMGKKGRLIHVSFCCFFPPNCTEPWPPYRGTYRTVTCVYVTPLLYSRGGERGIDSCKNNDSNDLRFLHFKNWLCINVRFVSLRTLTEFRMYFQHIPHTSNKFLSDKWYEFFGKRICCSGFKESEIKHKAARRKEKSYRDMLTCSSVSDRQISWADGSTFTEGWWKMWCLRRLELWMLWPGKETPDDLKEERGEPGGVKRKEFRFVSINPGIRCEHLST